MNLTEAHCASVEDLEGAKYNNDQYIVEENQTSLSKMEKLQKDKKLDVKRRKKLSLIRAWLPSLGAPATLLGVILMSFSDLFMEIATRSMNPVQVTVLFALAMFATSLMCAIIHSIKDKSVLIRKYNKQEWFYLLLCGITNAGGITLINHAIKFMPVGDAISILRSMPIFAGIIGWICLKQALRKIDFPFIILCVAGVVLIARPSFLFHTNPEETDANEVVGTTLALGSACCFALSFSVGKKLSDSKIQSYIIISINSCINLLLNCAIWFSFRRWDCAQHYVVFLTLAGGALTSFGQILVFWSVSREKVVVITVILASNIIYVYILQILVVHIIPHWLSGIGAVLILIACIGMAIRKNDKIAIGEMKVAYQTPSGSYT